MFTPEEGASLRLLALGALCRARKRPGTPIPPPLPRRPASQVTIDQESWEDVRPKAAVAANVGSGPDMVMSWFDDPFQYPDKLVDVTDLAPIWARRMAAGMTGLRPTARRTASGSRRRFAPSATPSAIATAI
jgi:multiple sugar transport system substrate-binding protein